MVSLFSPFSLFPVLSCFSRFGLPPYSQSVIEPVTVFLPQPPKFWEVTAVSASPGSVCHFCGQQFQAHVNPRLQVLFGLSISARCLHVCWCCFCAGAASVAGKAITAASRLCSSWGPFSGPGGRKYPLYILGSLAENKSQDSIFK